MSAHFIILGSPRRYDIGTQLIGLTDGEQRWHHQPFVIVREATYQEWLDQLSAHGQTPSGDEITHPRDFFYAVSTD